MTGTGMEVSGTKEMCKTGVLLRIVLDRVDIVCCWGLGLIVSLPESKGVTYIGICSDSQCCVSLYAM
jgi:hypothetical protein